MTDRFFHAPTKSRFSTDFRSFSRSTRELPGSFWDVPRVRGSVIEVPGMILGCLENHETNRNFHEKIEIFHDYECFFECFRFEFVLSVKENVFESLRGHA